MYRPQTIQWDWTCVCGKYNFAGRRQCYSPGCPHTRIDGVTVLGFVRGQAQYTQAALEAHSKQLVVLVYGRLDRDRSVGGGTPSGRLTTGTAVQGAIPSHRPLAQ